MSNILAYWGRRGEAPVSILGRGKYVVALASTWSRRDRWVQIQSSVNVAAQIVSLRWQCIRLTSICGNRFLKVGTVLLMIFCLISVFLLIRDMSRSIGQRPCPSRLNGIPFLMRLASRCENRAPFLVLLVTSSPDQFQTRSVIRRTWGSERLVGGARSVTYFLLGHGGQRQDWIMREGTLHQDIIQGDFKDTYHNLTLKVLLGLEWLCCSCPSASFVMKTDSDMFVNTDYLMKLLSRDPHRKNLLTGIIMKGFRPIRKKSSKWYVSKDEYPRDKYPPYCSGTGYVLSTDLACRVWEVSEKVAKIKIEDAYVGLCLEDLKVEPMKIHSQQVFYGYKVPFSICTYRQLITSHWVRDHEKLLFWRGLQDSADEKCPGEP
ncbi:LOW QUALITY PROTEIN: beta-1,3-galactosyltransferase 5-like [Pristis pectinata]|uniref:LOW QUALITY PROTEIN: beta-1,3-galactosyltransferase 5-like n=1 Tax=Pristis pectinata TaxID=685728 RepID=UPI00223D396E|nr:LOW QUALITY PROTEIN: beta-1,3-galactosyltransferase 5-like [Pristis pectinata]